MTGNMAKQSDPTFRVQLREDALEGFVDAPEGTELDYDSGPGVLAEIQDYYVWRDGCGGYLITPCSKIDPEHWDAGHGDSGTGLPEVVPAGHWQLVLIYNDDRHFRVVYGQKLYETLELALAAFDTYYPDVNEAFIPPHDPVKMIAVRQGANDLTNLTEARFLSRLRVPHK